ncbi:MAG: hypothetical protein KDA78_17795 [Planctomycetaceae bacterium]|nr:hypothetical protein [Planctomycetaceae bacterium]
MKTEHKHPALNDLQLQLDEKDEVIAMLTQQLENAADRLDQLQHARNGAASKVVLADVPDPLLEQTAESISYLVEEWNQSELNFKLEQIQSQLDELLSRSIELPSGQPCIPPVVPAGEPHPVVQDANQSLEAAEWLESLKEALLDHEVDEPEVAIPDEELEDNEFCQYDGLNNSVENQPEDKIERLPPIPETVDLATASRKQLEEAITKRDDFIEMSIRMYRDLRSRRLQLNHLDESHLSQLPAEQNRRIQELIQNLEEQSRLNEVTLSLERARLSREATQLTQCRDQMRKYAKQHDLDVNDIPDLFRMENEPGQTQEQRKQPNQKWLSLLRIKNQDS